MINNTDHVLFFLRKAEDAQYGTQLNPGMAAEIIEVIVQLCQDKENLELELAKLEHHLATRAGKGERL